MNKLYVIKIGGNIIDDSSRLEEFLDNFAQLSEQKILVHGGGKMATRLADQLGITQQMVDGRRVTDAETLKVVTMVYAGYINKNIVAGLQRRGCNAFGLTGADGNAILAHKRRGSAIDYGFAGDIDTVNTPMIASMLQRNDLVFAPITHDRAGQLLNTNADTIAQELATALTASFEVTLIYGFEKAGVLLDANDDKTVISSIDPRRYIDLKANNVIFAGMIPKLDNAFSAINRGVKQVVIGRAEDLPGLVKGTSGTTILNGTT